MARRPVSVLLTICWLCALAAPLAAQDSKADQQYQFARYLQSDADFFRAITELKRFRFQYPEDPRARNVDFLIADCYYQAHRWKEALHAFQEIETTSEGRKGTLARLRSARCMIELEATGKAVEQLHALTFQTDSADTNTGSYSLMMTTLAVIRDKDVSRTKEMLTRLCQSNDNATAVAFGQASLMAVSKFEREPKKSPTKAVLLSTALPGAGQIYAGKRADGLVAAASILLFSALAADASHSRRYGERDIFILFNAGQYLGNIYGARRAAKLHNRMEKERLFKALNDNLVSTIDRLPMSSELPCD
ncbi:MAG: CDC27 family protein [Armatimonadota bacterium]|nr:CDC27 family protein [Armatimonadota bacterium]